MTSSTIHTSAPQAGSDSISSWGENPLLHATRICLSFLQGLFGDADLPEGNFKWVADRETTEIIISDESPLHMDVINKRPAIVTVRSPVAFAGIALEQLQSLSIRTGERVHTDMVAGHMTFNCLSSKKVEAEQIAWLVARHLWILHRAFLAYGFHKFGEKIQVLAASPAGALIAGDTQNEMCSVPVVVPIFFQWTESITPLNLAVLNRVEANMQVQMAGVNAPATRPAGVRAVTGQRKQMLRGPVRPPHIRGRPIATATNPGGRAADPPLTVTIAVDEE